MNWNEQWGKQIKFLKKIEEDSGQTPEALLSRPILSQFEQPIFDAFTLLSNSRGYGMSGPLPISMSEIKAYFDIFDITDIEEREEYIMMIQRLDSVYLQNFAAKVKR